MAKVQEGGVDLDPWCALLIHTLLQRDEDRELKRLLIATKIVGVREIDKLVTSIVSKLSKKFVRKLACT